MMVLFFWMTNSMTVPPLDKTNIPVSFTDGPNQHWITGNKLTFFFLSCLFSAREENVATFRGSEYFCYDLSQNPIQSSSDEITLSFKTWQRNGLILHTGKSADYVNLALKDGAVSLVINLGSGAFEAIVEPVNGKFNDNAWHDIKVTRNLRQVITRRRPFLRLLTASWRTSSCFSSNVFMLHLVWNQIILLELSLLN